MIARALEGDSGQVALVPASQGRHSKPPAAPGMARAGIAVERDKPGKRNVALVSGLALHVAVRQFTPPSPLELSPRHLFLETRKGCPAVLQSALVDQNTFSL